MPALGELPGARPEPYRGREEREVERRVGERPAAAAGDSSDDALESAVESNEESESSEARRAPDPRRRFRP